MVPAMLLAAAVLLGACDSATVPATSDAASPAARANAGTVRIAAATSLTDALTAMKVPFETANPSVHLSFVFGASATLATQVDDGAADILLVDDIRVAETVVANKKAAGPAAAIASDPIVLIVPTANPGGVKSPLDLRRPGVRIVTTGSTTPLAAYASQVATNLSRQVGYTADFGAAVAGNTRAGGDDAKALVGIVESGGADAAFVYANDAAQTLKVVTVGIPDAAQVRATFAVVVLARALDPVGAAAFANWLVSRDGQAILAQAGFGPPGS
jgi:molybdate transport system substrate-binding protein